MNNNNESIMNLSSRERVTVDSTYSISQYQNRYGYSSSEQYGSVIINYVQSLYSKAKDLFSIFSAFKNEVNLAPFHQSASGIIHNHQEEQTAAIMRMMRKPTSAQ